ncbi:MAG: HAMP domain-containing histidine kinase [Clostridia bacterium]|nr:HAMP domain-containing histidine kinase [Clostridia bacterium]
MIKKLRRKFIEVTMISVFIVLFVMMFAINLASFRSLNEQIDNRLAFLCDIGGKEAELGPEVIDILKKHELSSESVFDMRYFTVFFSEDEGESYAQFGRDDPVREEDAISMALAVKDGEQSDFYEGYKYTVTVRDGGELYIFLDCSRELNSFYTFLTSSFIISMISLLLVFVLVCFFARVVMSPIAETYRKQRRFITDAGHELKTPLTIIRADAEVIEMENGESEWTESIKKQTERLTELTEKLVLLSRMEESEGKLPMAELCLSELLTEAAESFHPVANARGIAFTAEIAPEVHMLGDAASLSRLIALLLDNAFKYTDGEVCLALTESGRTRRITVKNTVSEIEVGNHDQLFERFYRADASRNSEQGGHGIGLAVAAAIVRTHKGKITARSEDGRSLTVSVLL